MKFALLLMLTLALLSTACAAQDNKSPDGSNSAQQNSAQFEDLKQRFLVKYPGVLGSAMWTLTHDYKSKKDSDEVLKDLQKFLTVLQSGKEARLSEVGGLKGFKDKFREYLKSEDGTIKGFAAIVLGITGDAEYAAPIAALIAERDKSFTEPFVYPPVTYRGRAAAALGILGAKQYLPQIVLLLKSRNSYDQSGAVSALSYFGAKEYAKDVAALLFDKDFQITGDLSPIYFLLETGTAKDYKKELAQVMLEKTGGELSKGAMYAFVRLDSKENAKDIAKLLGAEFRKGDAAKALALLDAKEYADAVAALLDDQNSLVRKDAALALGILKAKNHAAKIAGLLAAKENFVRYYAAVALILLEAKEFYPAAIPIIEQMHRAGAYLNDGDFHPLIPDKSQQVRETFKQLLEQAKAAN